MEENKKTKMPRGLLIGAVVIILLGVFSCVCYDKGFLKNNKEEKVVKEPKNLKPIAEFDFDTMETKLKEYEVNYDAYVSKCKSEKPKSANAKAKEMISINDTRVSKESMNTIIDKLKESKGFYETTEEFPLCPPKQIMYFIGENPAPREFEVLYPKNNENELIVGYDGTAYRFYYEDSNKIKNFIETIN